MDEVLAAAGAGKGQFYHYFRGRDDLAAAAVGYRCAQVMARLTQALGAVSSLAGLEQALAAFIAGFEQMGMPACLIGTLATRMAGLAGVDAGRVRQWLFARSVQESIGSPLMRQVARQLAPA